MTLPSIWATFTQDPRRPESARLRASDRDREVVMECLTEGYAEGRLDRSEYDERVAATTQARTLGELPAMIADLVPDRAPRAAPEDLHALAVRSWEAARRQALLRLLVPSLVCWAIWVASGWAQGAGFDPAFPWPLFVMLGTGAHALRVLTHRQDIIDEEQRRLEKKQRKALGS
jgi:hypothetical protein